MGAAKQNTKLGIGIGVASLLLAMAGLAVPDAGLVAAECLAFVLGAIALVTGRGALVGFVGLAISAFALYSVWVTVASHVRP